MNTASTKQIVTRNGSEEASAEQRLKGLGIDLIPGSGLLPATVPGAFDAWMLLLLEHGTWRLRDVLEFAISYAANGHPMVSRIVKTIENIEKASGDRAGQLDFKCKWIRASEAERLLKALLGDPTAYLAAGKNGTKLPLISHDTGTTAILASSPAHVSIRTIAIRHTLDGPAIDARSALIDINQVL